MYRNIVKRDHNNDYHFETSITMIYNNECILAVTKFKCTSYLMTTSNRYFPWNYKINSKRIE